MSIREAIEGRMTASSGGGSNDVDLRLPLRLKTERMNVKNGMLRRLASSRAFSLGDRSGVLRAARGRSGRAFRLDVRQRVIVKALVCRHTGKGADRAAGLAKHVAYLGRAGAGVEGGRPNFFDQESNDAEVRELTDGWSDDRHHFRFIISPEHCDRIDDMKGYVRDVMARVSADLGDLDLRWIATCHFDTDHPHAHVLLRGRRPDGRDLVIPRDYIGYGFRARAQEAAQERLGELSRAEAERRVWKETTANRFTAFDRRLLSAVGEDGMVEDGVGGSDAWTALSRGRLRHLEGLGLATREGRRFRPATNMEAQLRSLQMRRDVIRTLNQRRLDGARDVRILGVDRTRGKIVRAGFHDEAGASPYVVIRETSGAEVYARLRAGSPQLEVGRTITLAPLGNGLAQIAMGRGAHLQR